MAKKRKGFDFSSFIDQDSLNTLMEKGTSVAPTKEEISIVANTEGAIQDIPLNKLDDYHNHTFSVLDNEDMGALVDSIDKMGIILPLTVRQTTEDRYEIIAGHRRKHAAEILGLKTVPCKIIDVDDATADIMMVDTNLHREEISPSEKARSFDIKLRAMQKKGLTTDELPGSKHIDQLAEEVRTSRANIYRYIKLLQLSPGLMDMVDKGDLSVNAGAKLASIPVAEQTFIEEALKEAKNPVTIEAADKIVTASKSGLSKEKIIGILDGSFKPRKAPAQGTARRSPIREKNISYPAPIKSLSGKDREAFISECIKAYLEEHDEWNGHKLI